MITQDELTDIAMEAVSDFEPARNYDVFDVAESSVTFQDERGLFTLYIDARSCEAARQSIKSMLHQRG